MKALRQTPAAPSRVGFRGGRAFGHAAVVGAAFERPRDPGVEAWSADSKASTMIGGGAVAGAVVARLVGVEDAAVRGIEAGLGDGADGAGGGEEILEADRVAGAKARAVLQAHPRLGDDAEDALRADEQAIGARAGAGAGQAPRLDDAARRDHAQAFDEVVDVGVERREMAAGAGRDPAAERRVLEALREVPERRGVRAERVLERGTEDAALDPRRPRACGRSP